eukprot:COSAG01_NODE_2825_length_7004_cov_6.813034_9_plen_520_part_00
MECLFRASGASGGTGVLGSRPPRSISRPDVCCPKKAVESFHEQYDQQAAYDLHHGYGPTYTSLDLSFAYSYLKLLPYIVNHRGRRVRKGGLWSVSELLPSELYREYTRPLSRIQIRTEQTKAGADGPGSAGLLSFNPTMTREERTSAAVDVAAGGTLAANNADDATTRGVAPELFHTTAPRSDKHELLLKNCSSNAKNVDGSETEAVEISAPLGQTFAFCRQDKAFIPNVQVQVSLVVSEHFAKDMFFSEQLRGGASSGGVKVAFQAADTGGTATETPILKTAGAGTALTADATLALFQPSVAAVAAAPTVTVDELFLDVMMAVPSTPMPPIPSMQIPYQGIEVYTRTLAAGSSNFTESFSSIPASLSALVVGLRTSTHGINQNRELYALGGSDTTGIKTLSVQVGSLILPRPSTPLDMSNHQIGRLFADWLSFTGGSYSSGVGGDSLTEFVTSPLIPFRILQSKGEYSSTALVRLETKGALPADSELVLWVIHSKVFEAFWQQGEIFPNRVIVDDVLN